MIRRLLPYMKGYQKPAIIGPLLMVLEVACELVLPLLMANIIDIGINGNAGLGYILQQGIAMILLACLSMFAGVMAIDRLRDGDKILISEGCTHHRQCGDIGTVKLPKWISDYTGKQLEFEFTSGRDFPEDLSPYALVIHCGGCMLTEREMQYRARHASDSGIPMSNYGIIIAHTHGILRRSLEPFKDILNELN